MKSFRRLVWLL